MSLAFGGGLVNQTGTLTRLSYPGMTALYHRGKLNDSFCLGIGSTRAPNVQCGQTGKGGARAGIRLRLRVTLYIYVTICSVCLSPDRTSHPCQLTSSRKACYLRVGLLGEPKWGGCWGRIRHHRPPRVCDAQRGRRFWTLGCSLQDLAPTAWYALPGERVPQGYKPDRRRMPEFFFGFGLPGWNFDWRLATLADCCIAQIRVCTPV